MKTFITAMLVMHLPALLIAQTNFSTVTYGTSTYQPQEIFFGDSTQVYNVGQCSIRGTTNGEIYWTGYCYTILYLYGGDAPAPANCFVVGKNGTIRKNESCEIFGSWQDQTSGTTDSLFSVKFFNIDTGFVVGQNGKVLRTFNNGRNWTILSTSGTTQTLRRIIFTPDRTLYACGDNGVIIKSTDNANSWSLLNTNTTERITDIDYVGNDTLYAVGTNGLLIRTTDAGVTWTTLSSGVTVRLNGVDFITPDLGFVVGDSGKVRRTADGGNSWTSFIISTYNNNVMDIKFRNDSVGYFASQSVLYKTTDAGLSWVDLGQELQSVEFPTRDTGYAVGGVMRKTTDGGVTWSQSHPFNYPYDNTKMYDACFINKDTGWTSGYYGAVYKTTDGGNSWTWQNTHCTALLRSIHFFNANDGIAVGTNYTTSRTNNGGTTWVTDSFPNPSYYGHHDIFFVTPLIGYRCGSQGTISKTINGGATFASQTSGTTYYLLKIYFLDSLKGFAIGEHGTLLRTTNGGNTWTTQNIGVTSYLAAIAFYDSLNGYIAGESGVFFVTKDGGNTWTYKSNNFGTLLDITFFDGYHGYMVGAGDYRARYEPLKALNDFSDLCSNSGYYVTPIIPPNLQVDSGNIFILELDTTGNDFTDPVVVGASARDTGNFYLNLNLPDNIKAGRYKFRMRATKAHPVNASVPTTVRVFDDPFVEITISGDTLFATSHPDYLYQWRNGYTNITGANSNFLVITQSGEYNVLVKYGCCSDGYASVNVNQCNGQWISAPVVKTDYFICDSTSTTLFAGGASQYHWYDSDTGTTVLSTDSFFVTPVIEVKDTFYVAALYGTCESNRMRIIVNTTSKPLPPIVSNYFQCNSGELFIFPQGGTVFNWYNDSSSLPFLSNASFYHMANPVSDTLYVTNFNYDCQSEFVPLIIQVGNTPIAQSITGDTTVVPFQSVTYYYPSTPGNTLQWFVTGGTFVQFNDSIVVTWSAAGTGTIQLVESDPNGCIGDMVILQVDINIINALADNTGNEISIYPNPCNNVLHVNVMERSFEDLQLEVYDPLSRLLYKIKLHPGCNNIVAENFPGGILFLKLMDGEHTLSTKLIYKVD